MADLVRDNIDQRAVVREQRRRREREAAVLHSSVRERVRELPLAATLLYPPSAITYDEEVVNAEPVRGREVLRTRDLPFCQLC